MPRKTVATARSTHSKVFQIKGLSRRSLLQLAGVAVLGSGGLIGEARAQSTDPQVTLLSAPLKSWSGSGRAPPQAAARVLSRMREVSLLGMSWFWTSSRTNCASTSILGATGDLAAQRPAEDGMDHCRCRLTRLVQARLPVRSRAVQQLGAERQAGVAGPSAAGRGARRSLLHPRAGASGGEELRTQSAFCRRRRLCGADPAIPGQSRQGTAKLGASGRPRNLLEL